MTSRSTRVKRCVAFFALLLTLVCGDATVFAQEKSSAFYSTYDARALARNKKYKGIDFAYGDMGSEASSELQGVGAEKIKSISYFCRTQPSGDDGFKLAEFLEWLLEETVKQIEGGQGKVTKKHHKVGRRFYIEYAQKEFTGRVEVYGDMSGESQLDLDVEITEISKK
jgi:hypothetical protein